MEPIDIPDFHFQLGRIDANVQTLLKRGEEDRKTTAELASRISALERWRWHIVGAATVVSSVAAYVVAHLT